jgi:hypothetical protein
METPAFFMRSKIYLKTKITDLGRAPTVRIANMVFRWCRRNLGVNGRKKYQPVWYIRKGWSAGEMGEYDAQDNELYIYWDNIPDVRELIQTIVHEWTHQNQPILTKYHKYPGTYSRNPYERAARYAEIKWTPVIWQELKNKINKQ